MKSVFSLAILYQQTKILYCQLYFAQLASLRDYLAYFPGLEFALYNARFSPLGSTRCLFEQNLSS